MKCPKISGVRFVQGMALMFLLLPCPFAYSNHDASLPLVRWMVEDGPPVFDGRADGGAFGDQYLRSLIKRLPDFTHRLEASSTERTLGLMHAGITACSANILQSPDREKFVTFSQRSYVQWLGTRLVTSEGVAKGLSNDLRNPKGEVNLDAILNGGQIRLGIVPTWHYGSAIDYVLQKYRNKSSANVLHFRDDGSVTDLIRLIGKGRIDATIAGADEVEYALKEIKEPVSVSYFFIAGAEPYLPGHISCANTPLGRKVIRAIDALKWPDSPEIAFEAAYLATLPTSEQVRYRHAFGTSH